RQVTPRKQTACRASYANVTRITPAGNLEWASLKPLLPGDNRDAPRALADFDAAQFFARFYIDKGDVVCCAGCGVKLRACGIERDSLDEISDGDCCLDFIFLHVDQRDRVAAAC